MLEIQEREGGTIFSVRVQPRASKDEVAGEMAGALKVRRPFLRQLHLCWRGAGHVRRRSSRPRVLEFLTFSVSTARATPPFPGFSYGLILKADRVVCFDPVSQMLSLRRIVAFGVAARNQGQNGKRSCTPRQFSKNGK